MIVFVLAGLLAICFWFAPVNGEWLRRTAFWLCILGLAVHTVGWSTAWLLKAVHR
jgi:hypothetical protein